MPPSRLVAQLQPHALTSSDSACSRDGCWPSVYFIGAQKAGSTSLSEVFVSAGMCVAYWHNESEMLMPPASRSGSTHDGMVECREVHAFDTNYDSMKALLKSPSRYTRLFGTRAKCKSGVYMDATPVLHHWLSSVWMRAAIPAAKLPRLRLIAVLREPISRDLSEHNHKLDGVGALGTVGLGDACPMDSYKARAACHMELWNTCLAESGSAGRSLWKQYSSCPGWDQVMMNSDMVQESMKTFEGENDLPQALRLHASSAHYGQGGHLLMLPKGMCVVASHQAPRRRASFAAAKHDRLPRAPPTLLSPLLVRRSARYWGQLKRWTHTYNRQHILVVNYESIVGDTPTYSETLRGVLDFAGLPLTGAAPELPHLNVHSGDDKASAPQHTLALPPPACSVPPPHSATLAALPGPCDRVRDKAEARGGVRALECKAV